MSGHFILNNISRDDLSNAVAQSAAWGKQLHHAGVRWNDRSRKILSRALNSLDIPEDHPPHNRDGLPPHRYLQWDKTQGDAEAIADWLNGTTAEWVDRNRLLRPTGKGLGLTSLCEAARTAWGEGQINEALSAQFTVAHSLIIEIYHLGHEEMHK
ncbi:hypothetical protein [Streptomyces sp. C10-9-1]|uniref:hypothetical protein n=1 Tax=Streptomyces sp. C10-9-1 TaxID=1859285 RepID=UPI003D765041